MKKIKSPINLSIENPVETLEIGLLVDCRRLINEAKQAAAVAVNIHLTQMYWRIGERIRVDVLAGERAAYGKEVLLSISKVLVLEYGRGFEEKNLRRMVQFAEAFPDEKIVATLWRQLSWSHFFARSKLQLGNEQQSNRSIKHACRPPDY